jgi:hypothetical protein
MRTLLPSLLLLIATPQFAQTFKVIGYLPDYRLSYLNSIEFDRVTHVNISFANPDSLGNLSCEGVNIDPAVTKAHQHGCKVFISLAGGYLTSTWQTNWTNLTKPANRPAYIQKIVQYVLDHNFDGVDIDLEWSYVADWYSPFVMDLKTALSAHGKPLSAALPGNYRYPQITNQALNAFDWVNMMVYDLTGPWDPAHPGQHSPYDWAVQCIQYWKGQNVASARLMLGVPFYGYDFGVSPVNAFTYRGIVAQDPANAQLDQSGQKYWNGIPTIKAKTQLAMNDVGGIMIWELGEDAFGADQQYSLLRAIDQVVHPVTAVADLLTPELRLYPNPTSGRLTIELPDAVISAVRVFDAQGRLVMERLDGQGELEVAELAVGVYGVQVTSGAVVRMGRFLRL